MGDDRWHPAPRRGPTLQSRWAFHARDPAIEAWTIAQALEILHGRAAG